MESVWNHVQLIPSRPAARSRGLQALDLVGAGENAANWNRIPHTNGRVGGAGRCGVDSLIDNRPPLSEDVGQNRRRVLRGDFERQVALRFKYHRS